MNHSQPGRPSKAGGRGSDAAAHVVAAVVSGDSDFFR